MNLNKWILLLFTLGILTAGCGRENTITSTPDIQAIYTAAAETAQALITTQPTAEGTTAATFTPPSTGALATNTPSTPTATLLSTAPSGGQTPVNTCDVAGFVADITIPDGSQLAPGETFTKTWEISNEGTCTWNASYEIVYSSGEQMGAPATQALTTGTVAPGETLKVSLEMTTPTETGQYKSYWILRNDQNQYFGIGTTIGALYLDITVAAATETVSPTSTTEGATSTDTPEPSDTPAETDTLTPEPSETS